MTFTIKTFRLCCEECVVGSGVGKWKWQKYSKKNNPNQPKCTKTNIILLRVKLELKK